VRENVSRPGRVAPGDFTVRRPDDQPRLVFCRRLHVPDKQVLGRRQQSGARKTQESAASCCHAPFLTGDGPTLRMGARWRGAVSGGG